MNFLVSGGTGFVGSALVDRLAQDRHAVTILTRRSGFPRAQTGVTYFTMSADSKRRLPDAVAQADCVVNLAGEPIVGKRWTKLQKEHIIQSRVRSTAALVEAISRARKKPECLISASAIGFYGPRGNEELDEKGSIGIGFLADKEEEK